MIARAMLSLVACILVTGSVLTSERLLAQTTPKGADKSAVQPAPDQKAPPKLSSVPQNTTASFGDWILRCSRTDEAAAKVCEVAQQIQVRGQQGLIAQIAVGRIQKTDPMKATVIVPNNIALPSSIRIGLDEKDETGIELQWRRCLPLGCVADAELGAQPLARLRSTGASGRLLFKDGAGNQAAIPLSFYGMTQALDALLKE